MTWRATLDPRPDRRGFFILIPTLLMSGLLLTMMLSLHSRVGQFARCRARHRDRTVVRLLLDSAVEEVFLRLQKGLATPGSAVHAAFTSGGREVPAGDVIPVRSREELAVIGSPRPLDLATTVRILARDPISSDPAEAAGLVEVRVELVGDPGPRGGPTLARAARPFHLAAVGWPADLARSSILITNPGSTGLKQLGRFPAAGPREGGERSFVDLLRRPAPVGLVYAFADAPNRVAERFGTDGLARRAHHVLPDAAGLLARIGENAALGRPTEGIYHVADPTPVVLDFPAFSGRAILSFNGPVIVRSITLTNPSQDSLTIVSGQDLVVAGDRVEANLVCPAGTVALGARTRLEGLVVTRGFPRPAGIPAADYRASRLAPPRVPVGPEEILGILRPVYLWFDHDEDETGVLQS